jgi:hypothetical protein
MATLVMELTLEQGAGRETQMQPPKGVWARYFDLDFDVPGTTLEVRDMQAAQPAYETRAVVEHDHNWTLEIPSASLPRPAIFFAKQTGLNRYDYWVLRPHHAEYPHLEWLLANVSNPHHAGKGRKWLII